MTKGSKPTPPPLDADEQAAAGSASDVPHAESGKATAEDAQRATADAARAAAPPAAPPPPDDDDAPLPPVEQPPALIADSGGQLVARPNPLVPFDPKADLVLMNWFGHVKGEDGPKQVHVKYGTPFKALPADVRAALRKTTGVQIGPLPPKPPQNPFTP